MVITNSQCRLIAQWLCVSVAMICLLSGTVMAQPASSITISTETTEIYGGDVAVIEIQSIGLLDPLNIAPLKDKAHFLRETTGTQIAVINGKVVEIALRRMEFIIDKEGTYLFGPLQADAVGGQIASNSVSVKVLPALKNAWQPEPEDTTVSVTTTKTSPLFGEQVLLNIEFEHRYPIADETIELPAMEQFDVIAIHEERRTINNETNMRNLSWRYLIHPRLSGSVALEGIRWSGTMIRSRTQRGTFELTPNPMILNVLPSKVDNNEWWLPATRLAISEQWSKDIKTLSAGDEVLRTITVVADGIQASQLPDVTPLQSRAIQTDLIDTKREHELLDERTRATGTYIFRVTALSPIPVFLDTVRVPWWNVVENESKEAIIPARRINVGLPDRADLLADLSLRDSFMQRWWNRLQSATRWRHGAYLLFGFSALLMFWFLVARHTHNFKSRMRKKAYYHRLKKALRRSKWREAHQLLLSNESESLNIEAKEVIEDKLGRKLFSNGSDELLAELSCNEQEIRNLFQPNTHATLKKSLPLPAL